MKMVKDIAIEVDGLTIKGQLHLPVKKRPSTHPTVCICHGIPADKPGPTSEGYPLLAEKLSREGFAALIFNFRGTRTSGGNLGLPGWTRDLKGIIDYLFTAPEVDKSHLSLLGFSAGAAVAIHAASQDSRISCIASCASPANFSSITEADRPQAVIDHFRNIGTIRDDIFPPSIEEWLDGFRQIKPVMYVSDITPKPLLLIHGNCDDVVPLKHAYELYEKAKEPKHLIIVDGAKHRLRDDDRAMAIVIDWLKSHCL